MSSIKNNIKGKSVKAPKGARIGIVKSDYNPEVTDVLLESCVHELTKSGIDKKNIKIMKVPGAFEIPFTCQNMLMSGKYDAIIALGAVIQGETPHFKYIAKTCALGIMNVSLKMNKPIIFGVLTTENLRQAKERTKGGGRGDKGVESAIAALKVIGNW